MNGSNEDNIDHAYIRRREKDGNIYAVVAVLSVSTGLITALVGLLPWAFGVGILSGFFSLIIMLFWNLRGRIWYWLTVGAFFATNLYLVIKYPLVGQNHIERAWIWPLAILDGVLMVVVISALDVYFKKSKAMSDLSRLKVD